MEFSQWGKIQKTEIAMIDVASDLRERFDFAVLWVLERHEVMRDEKTVTELSDEDANAVAGG